MLVYCYAIMNKNLHLIQVNGFNPILKDLKEKGCNTDKLIKESDLHLFNLENPLAYVPAKLVYNLYDEINKSLGINNFIDEFSDYYQLIAIMQHGELMAYAPDVLTACQIAIKYDQIVFTNERLFLRTNGNKSMIASYFIDNPESGRENVIFTNIALMLNTFRLKFGHDWQPYDLYIQHDKVPNLDKLIPRKSETNVFVDQEFTGLTFDTSLLKCPMLNPVEQNSGSSLIKPLDTLSSKVESLLDSNHHTRLPSIHKFSEVSDMSLRTFQRSLAEEDTNFSQIIENWRFKKALEFLENTSIKIKEISQRLCYSNVSNFEHAFRRWTNTHPLHYRSKL